MRHITSSCPLRHPVRQHLHRPVGASRVVADEVETEIVRPAHVAVHHEDHRHRSLLARPKDHRTDGRCGRSTPLDDFNPRFLAEAQRLVADIGQLDVHLDLPPELDIPKVDLLL